MASDDENPKSSGKKVDIGEQSEKKVDLTYYLGSSDNSGNMITPIQLRGPNYDE
jgi:hypothetical protein